MSTAHDDAMLDLVAAYAAGAIDDTTGECATVREHLAHCAICREEYKITRAAIGALARSVEQAPPAQLRERVLSSLADRARSAKVIPLRSARWLWAAAAAAIVIISVGALWTHSLHPASRSWAAACVPGALNCHAAGTVSVTTANHLLLRVNGLSALPAGKAYQAWLIMPGSSPTPEPTLAVNERGEGLVEIAAAPAKGAIVALTVEPVGGSQKPTTKPFLVATL